MVTKRTSKFRDRVVGNSHKQKSQGSTYGHLRLPRGTNIYKEEPGRARLDFLPYYVTDEKHPDRDDERDIAVVGELWYKRPYKVHRNVGADSEMIVCPTSVGKPCPIHEYRKKRMKQGAEQEELKELKASDRNLYVVVPIGDKEYEDVPHIWDISQYLFQNKLNDEIDENEDYGAFPDLEAGYTLRIRFSEEQIGKNKFADTSRIDFEERDQQYDEDKLKDVPNLDEVLIIPTYEELSAKFFQEQPVDADEQRERVRSRPSDDETEPNQTERTRKRGFRNDDRSERHEDPEPPRHSRREAEPEPEKEVSSRERKRAEARREKEQAEKSDNQSLCPYGYKFGVETDKYPECDKCDAKIWDACFEAKKEKDDAVPF